MKFSMGEAMRKRTISNIIVIGVGILMYALIFKFETFLGFVIGFIKMLAPFLTALVTALIVAAPMTTLEKGIQKLIFKKKKASRLTRSISITICYIMLFLLLVAFIWFIVPQLVVSIHAVSLSVTQFFRQRAPQIAQFLSDYNITGENQANVLITWETIMSKSLDLAGKALLSIASMSASISNIVIQFSLGMVLSVYMLLDKERFAAQGKKCAYALMPVNRANTFIFWMRKSHTIFSNYITGKFVESLVVGIFCFLGMSIFRMEYAMLISVVVGITNIVPIFGAWIGAIVGGLILLMGAQPMNALWFLIFVLVLQQIDGNVIGPRILGNSTGLSAFWTVIALVVGGGLFGLTGMLLGIPVCAILYAIGRTVIDGRLARKHLSTKTEDYDTVGAVFVEPKEDAENH